MVMKRRHQEMISSAFGVSPSGELVKLPLAAMQQNPMAAVAATPWGGSPASCGGGSGNPHQQERKSSTNLYIRGLLPTDTDESIKRMVCDSAGVPSDSINSTKAVLDDRTGQCKGYGFVDLLTQRQAQEAMDALLKAAPRGGKLQISFARVPAE